LSIEQEGGAVDGGAIDGGWYLDVLGFARATPWLHGFFQVFTNAGLVLLALVVAVAWWRARRQEPGEWRPCSGCPSLSAWPTA
jgi:hypothetical protein